jgi:hypothetical protein
MAIIPLPERGQPLDLTYIYQIANAINNISTQVSSSTYRYVTIDTPSNGKESLNASETRMIAAHKEVVNNTTVSAGNEKSFEYSIEPELKYPPVVTATPVNIGDTSAGKNVSVVLKSVTTSRIEGVVRFNSSGDASVAVNLIILGVPNQ